MNYSFHFKNILVLIVFSLPISIFSQTLEWEYSTDANSDGSFATLTSEQSILHARSHQKDVAKFDNAGNLLWEKNICNCPYGMSYSKELLGGELLHLSSEGILYTSDSEGDNPVMIGHMLPDSLELDSSYIFDFVEIHETQKGLHATAAYVINNQSGFSSTTIDFNTFEITKEFVPLAPPYVLDRNQNLETGVTVELILNVNTNDERFHWYNIYDQNGQFLFLGTVDSLNLNLTDILINENQEVFVIGSQAGEPYNPIGLIRKYGNNGDLQFEKILKSENDTGASLGKAILYQNNLIVSGSRGTATDMGMPFEFYLAEYDGNTGMLNWKFTKSGGLATTSIAPQPDRSLIISGTSGYFEFEFARTVLMKINPNSSSTEQLADLEINIFPNPTTGLLNISDKDQEITKIELLDAYSKILVTKDYSETLDLSSFPTGTYFLKASTTKGSLTKKLIKL